MNQRPGYSLQTRLLLGVSSAVAVLWLAAAGLMAWDAHHELDELLDAHLTQSAALLVARQTSELEDDEDEDNQPAALLHHRYAHQVVYQAWVEGVLVLRSANAPAAPLGTQPEGFETRTLAGTTWRVFATRDAGSGLQVFVGEDDEARTDILTSLLRALLAPLLLGLPLILLACWWLIRRGLRPLLALQAELAGRDAQSLAPLPPLGRAVPAEIAPLRSTLNLLFERIASLLASERRFTADAAHELRTPIAAIRTQAQVALGATQEAERRHALGATLAGCDRATHLVQQLLTLSRLEAQGSVNGKPLDMAALAQRVAAELAFAALARGQALSLEAPAACWVEGDEALLGVLLRNLLDNAMRYSPPGASIALSVQTSAGTSTLTVEDSGPGLSDADLTRLGERFFRVLGNGADGSGLGWSIVQRIACAHWAQLRVQRSPSLGGLQVQVVFLPCDPPAQTAPDVPA